MASQTSHVTSNRTEKGRKSTIERAKTMSGVSCCGGDRSRQYSVKIRVKWELTSPRITAPSHVVLVRRHVAGPIRTVD